MDSLSLLIEWANGWGVSRGRPASSAVAGGVRIDLGGPGRAARYVLPALDRALLADLGDAWTSLGTEVKTLASSAALSACVGDGWSMYSACELMSSEFTAGPVSLPGGYTSRISRDGATIVAVVLDGVGTVASSARLARWGGYGIVDQVETSLRHRRRGMATAVMTLLGNWAVSNATSTGLLAATEQGAILYHRLGWTAHGEIAGAVRTR